MWNRRKSVTPEGFQKVDCYSKALQRRKTLFLRLPAEYNSAPTRRYPVLYLLHGSGHDPYSVLQEAMPRHLLGKAHRQVTVLDAFILVIPDGDQGWWLDSPLLPHSLYGRYLLELVDLVDRRYRTVASRAGRGLCGFSMGGYGAMLLACQHPDQFGTASSLLGPLDIVQLFPDYYRLRLLLGSKLATWRRYNPTDLAASLAHTALKFCTAEEAFDRSQNDAFATALQSLNIPFEYNTYPGGHNTIFVREHIAAHLVFHQRKK